MYDGLVMDTVNQRGLLSRPYGDEDDDGGFEGKDFNGAHEMAVNGVVSSVSHWNGVGGGGGGGIVQATRTSELTIAFEGEVYVFPAVTSEKVLFSFFFLRFFNCLVAYGAFICSFCCWMKLFIWKYGELTLISTFVLLFIKKL